MDDEFYLGLDCNTALLSYIGLVQDDEDAFVCVYLLSPDTLCFSLLRSRHSKYEMQVDD